MFTIIIILIAVLLLTAVVVNAIQQHKQKAEAEKRGELVKLKTIIDEAEDTLLAAEYLPVSSQMRVILYERMIAAMQQSLQLNPKILEYKKRISELEESKQQVQVVETDATNFNISLPENEKQIILLIQGIKRLRIILRSENHKGTINSDVFASEDRYLDRYQLKVNMETLSRRIQSSLQNKMLGSARQYLEKAIAALKNQPNQDDYVVSKKADFENQLTNIHNTMRNANAEDTARRVEEDKDELDELFAPKKKW
ncbi:hypothetical protein [Neptunicella sp. SCSIO 80796]|uniref:hypothetical protein n=1 Tax=Neptunicella plasticusilytica TaxID=3117012 RepID=UPI003A4E30C8